MKHENRYWGDHTPPKSKAEFFDAVTTPAPAGDGTVATIRMYGPIDSWGGWWGISAKDVGQVLDALSADVTQIILRINSPGGEVFEGVSILNMLRAHKAKVTAVVDGLAASAASVIAAGCDETVMSPGTQMMIHSPWTITWGNATELRKVADRLDGVESSIVEIYVGKAGDDHDWTALLAEETWLTAANTVELGLADRVAVIPDAGETETVDSDDVEVITVTDDDDAQDSTPRVVRLAARATMAPLMLPVSTEPGDPNRKDEAMAYGDLQAGLRERLGVTDAAASDEMLLAALDETLTEQANTLNAPAVKLPDGVQMIDAAVLADLKDKAEQGAKALQAQTQTRREGILATALKEGRIAPASKDTWAALLEENEESAVKALDSLVQNTVPVTEVGHSDVNTSGDEALAAAAGWADDDTKEA